MIDQRVGRGAVLDEAINAALPTFYSEAAKENAKVALKMAQVLSHFILIKIYLEQ